MAFREGQMMPQIFPEYCYTQEQLKALQDKLYEGLKQIHEICVENNIQYMLSGGSCLGAVRHNDFIPWDDDVDVMMYPEEWEKLEKVINEKHTDKFTLYSFKHPKTLRKMVKIYINNTRVVGLANKNWPNEKSLWIDVFLFENCPKNKVARKFRALVHDVLYSLLNYKLLYKHPSDVIESKLNENKEMRRWYKRRRLIGFFSNIFPKNFYMNWIKKLQRYKKETGLICIPSAKKYCSEIFEKDFFKEVVPCKFRDIEMYIPKNYDAYMRNIYGDYMQIPPENKRERHLGIELNLDYKENK